MAVFSAFFLHPRIPSSLEESPINMLRHSVILTVISVNLEFMVWRSLNCSQWEVIMPMKDNKCYKTNRWPLVKLAADTENVVWEYLSEGKNDSGFEINSSLLKNHSLTYFMFVDGRASQAPFYRCVEIRGPFVLVKFFFLTEGCIWTQLQTLCYLFLDLLSHLTALKNGFLKGLI